MLSNDLRNYLETEIIEGLCDSAEDRLFKLAVLEAGLGIIDRDSVLGEKMIHLLDSVNDVLQKAGMVSESQTFYNQ